MNDEALDRFAFAFFDLMRSGSDDVLDFVLHPRSFDVDVLTYAATWKGAWGGPLLNGQDAWRTHRIQSARELWHFDRGTMTYHVHAAVYVLLLLEGDVLSCIWRGKRSDWTWESGDLARLPYLAP